MRCASRLVTFHNTFAFLEDGIILQGIVEDFHEAVFYRYSTNVAFLASSKRIVPFRICDCLTEEGAFSLYDPVTKFAYSAPPPDIGVRIAADRLRTAAWERFTALALPSGNAFTRTLDQIDIDPLGIADLLEALRTAATKIERACYFALIVAASASRMPQIVERIADDPDLPDLLADHDRWFDFVKRPRKQHGYVREIGVEYDTFVRSRTPPLPASEETFVASMTEGFRTLGEAVNAHLRRSTRPNKSICCMASVRNEGPYLLEWVAYHQALGVEAFFIFSNDNDDGSDALLQALADARVVTWIKNSVGPKIPPQIKAYQYAFSSLPDILDYEWAIVIDVDEFLVLNTDLFDGVGTYIEWHCTQKVDAIALNWLMFGSFGVSASLDELLTERCIYRHEPVSHHIKCIVRPVKFAASHCHYPYPAPETPVIFRSETGGFYRPSEQEFAFSVEPSARLAWLNHYWSKSLDEALLKFSRNSGNQSKATRSPAEVLRMLSSLVVANERTVTPVRDERAGRNGCREHLDRLLSIPAIARAHADTKRFSTERIRGLKTEILRLDKHALGEQDCLVRDMLTLSHGMPL